MNVSDATKRLREELNARGIAWRDDSEERGDAHLYHMERTKFSARGHGFSCIWGYMQHADGAQDGSTYGWPTMIECMTGLVSEEPEPMSVEGIMALVEGGDVDGRE